MVKVLVIEDDDGVRDSLKAALSTMGYMVTTASNGAEGLELFDDHKFDLVITDLIMPEKDGVETILELKLNRPDVKVVAISGSDQNLDVMETTYKLGADCALTKPFSMSDLRTCLDKIFNTFKVVESKQA